MPEPTQNWNDLVTLAHHQRLPHVPEEEAQIELPLAEKKKPKTTQEVIDERMPRWMSAIKKAIAEGYWYADGFYPDGIGSQSEFLALLNAQLPPPFRAYDNSTSGWDATDFFAIGWYPDNLRGSAKGLNLGL